MNMPKRVFLLILALGLTVPAMMHTGCSSDDEPGVSDGDTDGDTDVIEREVSEGGPLNPTGLATGFVIDPLRHIGDDATDTAAFVLKLKSSGYHTIAIPWVMQLGYCMYPTQNEHLQPYKEGLGDWIAALLQAADTNAMDVWIGLQRNRSTRHAWDDDPGAWELERMQYLADDLETRYGSHASFTGVWLALETTALPDDPARPQMAELARQMARHVHNHLPKRDFGMRIRYGGPDLSAFYQGTSGTWVMAADIEDSAEVTRWATAWMTLADEADINRFVIEAQNGAHRFAPSKAGQLAAAMELNRSGAPALLSVVADLYDTMPENLGIPRQPITARANWDAFETIAGAVPADAEVWVWGEGSFDNAAEQVADGGYPADIGPHMYESALWVANHLENTVLRDGQVVTVAQVNYDVDRRGNLWQEDACWLTGLYTSALTYKAMITGDDMDRRRAAKEFDVLMRMADTTPLFGEVVRNYISYLYEQNNPVKPDADTIKRWHRHPENATYWVGDISVDQMSGWLHGVATYYELLADETRKQRARQVVDAVASIIFDNDLHAKQFDGENATYGNFNLEPVMALELAVLAYHITGKDVYHRKFGELLEQGFMTAYFTKNAILFNIPGQANFQHFADSAFYHLLLWNTDERLHADAQLALQYLYHRSFNYGFAWGNLNYALFDPKSEGAPRAIAELNDYVPQHLENRRWLADVNKKVERGFVPMEVRPAGEFEWSTGLDNEKGGASPRGGVDHRFSGVGYLMAYWMGRYHGLIPEP